MVEYINKFDQLYYKTAEYDLTLGTGVRVYLLLKGAIVPYQIGLFFNEKTVIVGVCLFCSCV